MALTTTPWRRKEMKLPAHNPEHPVVAFDFDGVLAENTWPDPRIGAPDQDALNAVLHYFDAGCEVIVFTARPDSHFPQIKRWLENRGVGHCIYEVTGRKPQACLYFDDRAVRWPLDA